MTREQAIRELKIRFVGEYDRQREAKDMAIKALEQEPRWIPVSERLPKIQNCGGNYLVTLKSGGVHIGMFIERNGKHWWTHYDDVVAWMPLPTSYKPQKSEEE